MRICLHVATPAIFAVLLSGIAAWAGDSKDDESQDGSSIFARENLVAWCLVPFDASRRGPEERASMLERLRLKRFAYDWRAEHVPTFEEEILALKRHGIQLTAYWCSGGLSEINRGMFALFEKHGIRPQLWVMPPGAAGPAEGERIEAAVAELLPLVREAQRLGCRIGLYNHGGWQGEPETLVALVEELRSRTGHDHVGIVYNFHHGHEHLDRFPEAFLAMVPYLFCVNLNGMSAGGPKILPIGRGEDDLKILRIIRDSGYRGRIGILDHRADLDAEKSLRENLDGLEALSRKLDSVPGPPSR